MKTENLFLGLLGRMVLLSAFLPFCAYAQFRPQHLTRSWEQDLLKGKVKSISISTKDPNSCDSYTKYDDKGHCIQTNFSNYDYRRKYVIEGKVKDIIAVNYEPLLYKWGAVRCENRAAWMTYFPNNSYTETYQYEAQGELVSTNETSRYIYKSECLTTILDEHNNPRKQLFWDNGNIVQYDYYDSKGVRKNRIKITWKGNVATVTGNDSKYIYEYNINGQIVLVKIIGVGTFMGRHEYVFREISYQYNDLGYISSVKIKKFTEAENLKSTYQYKYTYEGSNLASITYLKDGKIDTKRIYKYTYDNVGNWIKQECYEVKVADIEILNKLHEDTRSIVYYTNTVGIDDEICEVCENAPRYLDGQEKLMSYFDGKLPDNSEMTGRVTAKFVVEKDGSVSHIEIIGGNTNLRKGVDAALKEMPAWKAGNNKWESARCRVKMILDFNNGSCNSLGISVPVKL